MKQYNDIKLRYPNTILLFRLGDFFETFGEDAIIAAKVLGITLTKRNNGAAGKTELAGFPHHQVDNYLPKLVRAGHRVAVCEQLEDPKKAKGIVKRGVVEVVTPGVAMYERVLESKTNNYLASIDFQELKDITIVGVSLCDISTGEFITSELTVNQATGIIESYNPAEIILNKKNKDLNEKFLKKLSNKSSITSLEDWIFELDFASNSLKEKFNTKSLKGFGIDNFTIGKCSAGAVLYYIGETQKSNLPQIQGISILNPSDYMILDFPTRRNLEITYSNDGSEHGTLFSVLDHTSTPMGGRLLKSWVVRPLIDLKKINRRLDSTESFYNNYKQTEYLKKLFSKLSDLERINVKIATSRSNPRDLFHLRNSLEQLPEISKTLSEISENLSIEDLSELLLLLTKTVADDPSPQIGSGNLFKSGYNSELDEYIEAKYNGKNWISELQASERERTGINSLKIGFNNVFGYYIDVTKVHASKVPENYVRRQTLTNSERYITEELKEFETKIQNAEEKIYYLETKLFEDLRKELVQFSDKIKKLSSQIAEIDCFISYAEVSVKHNYHKPIIDDSKKLLIEEGRHPVIESILPPGTSYTHNDTNLDYENEQLHIITGPNMSGKSSYLRQNALIILLGQIGCFVPAKRAEYGVVDRIFTRVGAQDNISLGESTFLVEMQETANIVNNATDNSLILLDEVGRGTATFDGLSIAWALTEFLHNNVNAKTLFATHYHELNELEERLEKVVNYRVEVIESMNKIVFTHKVRKGGSDHSFGIHVAKMAGLPSDMTDRANEIMRTFEADSNQQELGVSKSKPNTNKISNLASNDSGQLAIFAFEDDKLRTKLKSMKIEEITPIKAFQILAELIDDAKS